MPIYGPANPPSMLTATCVVCGIEKRITVDTDALWKYQVGYPVQECFPDMSADDRELFFISELCGNCWDAMINDEDDDIE